MRFYFLFLVCLLAGCAVQSPAQRPIFSVPDGTWEGALDWIIRADGSKSAGGQQLAVAACSGQARVWMMNEDGNFSGPRRDFRIRSNAQSHTIQFVDAAAKQPDWVEIQTYTLLEIDGKSAVLQWARAVNNRDLPANDANRTILEYGVGKLQRTKEECSNPPLYPL